MMAVLWREKKSTWFIHIGICRRRVLSWKNEPGSLQPVFMLMFMLPGSCEVIERRVVIGRSERLCGTRIGADKTGGDQLFSNYQLSTIDQLAKQLVESFASSEHRFE